MEEEDQSSVHSNAKSQGNDSDSSSDKYGKQKDTYVYDDFVVPDDAEQPQQMRKKKKKKQRKGEMAIEEEVNNEQRERRRLKKKKEQGEYQLDAEDYQLIAEQMEERKKQKVTVNQQAEQDQEDSDNDKDFIDDEERMKKEHHVQSKPSATTAEILGGQSALAQLHQVFYGGKDEEEKGQQAAIYEEEEAPEEKKKIEFKGLYEPTEIEAQFQTEEDSKIKHKDIPERMQLRAKLRKGPELPDSEQLVEETRWIFEKLVQQNKHKHKTVEEKDSLRAKIHKAIELLVISQNEVYYLHVYKKNELYPDLGLDDLWKILDYDLQWGEFYQLQNRIFTQFEVLKNYLLIHDKVIEMFDSAQDIQTLEMLQDYCQYNLSKYMDDIQQQNLFTDTLTKESQKPQFKQPLKRVFSREAVQQNLHTFAEFAGISADQLAENILNAAKPSEDLRIFKPKFVEKTPDQLADKFQTKASVLTRDNLETLRSVCKFMASELFNHPIIKREVKRMYFENVQISTEPTMKGARELDVYKLNYHVKRIVKRPLRQFTDETFLEMVEAEQQDLIQIRFQLPWEDDLKQQKQFREFKDEIFRKLIQLYITPKELTMSEEQQILIEKWNLLRSDVIKEYLSDFMYPYLQKLLRQELIEKAERSVVAFCSNEFRELLMTAPCQVEDPSAQEFTTNTGKREARVCAIVMEQRTSKLTVAFLNSNGELLDHMTLKFLGALQKQLETSLKVNYEQDKNDFKENIEKYKPDQIIVSANCLDAKRIKSLIFAIVEEMKSENKWKAWVSYVDYIVAQIYAKTPRAEKEFKGVEISLREAISLARFKQNPLAEVLNLWNEQPSENACLFIPFHDLMRKVSLKKLHEEFERVAVEIVNRIGVDINRMLKYKHLASVLQFVCGLGPRKATLFLEKLQQRCGALTMRREIWVQKIFDKLVYINSVGFLRLTQQAVTQFRTRGDMTNTNELYELLDTTRIHPENYNLAKKIASDALDSTLSDKDLVQKIMEKPQVLDDLDLEDYASHLAQTKSKPNMIFVLQFIQEELTHPFADPRVSKELDQKQLFYKLCKETERSFKRYSICTIQVLRVMKQNMMCKVQGNGLTGWVKIKDAIPDDKQQSSLQQLYNEGDVCTARVKQINFDNNFEVTLSLKPQDLVTKKDMLKDIIPNWEAIQKTFLIKEQEDFPQFVSQKQKINKYIPRKINHPKFKNMSISAACDYLLDKKDGDFVIRPSSKGTNHLNITWKFYENCIVHIDIVEGSKAPNELIAKKLYLNNQQYDSLDEIIEKYIIPCNDKMGSVVEHPKFRSGDLEKITMILEEQKEQNPRTIPYAFGSFDYAPQYIVLCYIWKGLELVQEYIKVKPDRLQFHEYPFQNIQLLITWFKENFKKAEYQRYLRKIKLPFQDLQKPNQNQYLIDQGYSPESEAEVTTEQIKEEKMKKESILHSNIQCNTCGGKGHYANECPSQKRIKMEGNKTGHRTPGHETNRFEPKNEANNDWAMKQESQGGDFNRSHYEDRGGNERRGGGRFSDRGERRGGRGGGRGGGNGGVRRCFKCNEEGHFANACPNSGNQDNNQQKCFKCGEVGHKSFECGKSGGDFGERRGGRRGGRGGYRGDRGGGGRFNKSRSRSRDRDNGGFGASGGDGAAWGQEAAWSSNQQQGNGQGGGEQQEAQTVQAPQAQNEGWGAPQAQGDSGW